MVFGTIANLTFTATTASAANAGTVVRLDPSEASPFNDGKFEGWGTSMGWWGNRIGHSDKMAQQAAEVFYSEDGLGLDIVRYNLGGGDQPGHNHITRSDSKLPTFAVPKLNEDNTPKKDESGKFIYTYDWTADHDQMNVLTRIKEQNPNVHIEGYTNSPPWFMTNTLCSGGGTVHKDSNNNVISVDENLSPDNYDDFAEYVTEVTKHFEEIGLKFDSYSPMNEPNPTTKYWGELSNKQEGNLVAQGDHQSGLINAISDAYDAADINTLVVGMDETDIGYSISSFNALNETAKANLDRLDTHTYGGSNRAGLKATAIAGGKNLWMSEVDGNWNGFGLADRIMTDLNGMQASAWVLWDIVDFHKDSTFQNPSGEYSEKNASLNVTGSMWGMAMGNHDTEEIELANKYYFYGQFTRYINPGDTIIASSNNTLAAYNKKTGDIKIVAANSGSADKKYTFDLSPFTYVGTDVQEIRTNNATGSDAEHWKEITGEAELNDKKLTTTLKAGTLTTYVISAGAEVNKFEATAEKAEYSYNVPASYIGCNKYFAIYKNGALKALTVNEDTKTLDGDFADCDFKLLVWDGIEPVISIDTVTEPADIKYAVIKGGSDQINVGASVNLTVSTNLEGSVTWSSSDESVATVSENGEVTALKSGSVTIYAKVGDFTVSRDFIVPMYTLSGTPSWGNDSNRPSDDADYTKAADGDFATYFDGTTGGYVQYDYGEPFKVSSVKLAARSGSGMPERTAGAVIQSSNDGINWTELYKISSAIPADEYTTVEASSLASDKAYRYYRYTNTTNMANIAEFIIEGEPSDDTPASDPVITDIAAFTDNFEGNTNMFSAPSGVLSDGGKVVFATGLGRFGNAFAPVKTTADASLDEAITLTTKDLFRLRFNMFAGWESSGKDNTFALKDADGNELVAIYITGGGYTLNQLRIGGKNVLDGTKVAQSRSNPGTNKAGANGWNVSGQPYVNTVGYNKTVEITIDGQGMVNVSLTGGMEDVTASGRLTKPVTVKTISLTGDYNAAVERVACYDNFDGDVITYAEDFAEPTPTPAPTSTPEPTDPPVLPESGELISLNFDNGDLASTSTYGKASGTPKFVTVDERKCIQFDGTNSTVVTLTDANGNPLLTGQKNITIMFKVKPTVTTTSWWFYAAPSASAQTYQQEKYLGVHTNGGKLNVERYSNSGSRSTMAVGEYTTNTWNDVIISVNDGSTSVYVNGALSGSADSVVNISDMLGSASIALIGKANWGNGEYATGYLDDFVIYNYAFDNALASLDIGDTSDVKENITLPAKIGDTDITWTTSNADVVTNAGVVTRTDDTQTAVLTASVVASGVTLTKEFNVTVTGKAAVLDTFAAYAENGSIKFTSDWTSEEEYGINVGIASVDLEPAYVNQVSNTASGAFADLAKGTYKVSATMNGKTVIRTVTVKDEQEMGAYLFAHFVGTESTANMEQIYFSVSTDGTTWKTLNGGSPVLTSNVGEKGVRDPYILRGENGKFYIIATDLSIYNLGLTQGSNKWGYSQTNGSKNIIVWSSDNLTDWSAANPVKVGVDNAGCVWAPEAVYDAEKGKYMVFWASKVSTDNYGKQRMYRSYTEDFTTFTEPEVYIDNQSSAIDTTIIQDKGMYYRFTKDETHSAVTMMKSASLSSGWKDVDTYKINGVAGNTVTGYEGPTIYKLNNENKWCLLLDFYSKSQGYKPFITNELTKGEFTSASDFNFDATYRHGTVMPITTAEYNALIAKYPLASN